MRILVLLTALVLTGCANHAERIADASATVESIAQTVQAECGNTQPGGPCTSGSLIDTETKNEVRDDLRQVVDLLQDANRMLLTDERGRAGRTLDRVESLLVELALILAERGM